MKYIIGIDASTTKTGVSIYKVLKSGKKLYKYELIDAEKNTKIPDTMKTKSKDKKKIKKEKSNQRTILRVEYTIHELLKILHTYQKQGEIVKIGMEDTYGTVDVSSTKSLARIQGSVLGFALEYKVDLQFINPSSWRKKVGIPLKRDDIWFKREDLKQFAVKMVRDLYHIDVIDDIADAILIGAAV